MARASSGLTRTEKLLGMCGLFLIGLIGAIADRWPRARRRRQTLQHRDLKT